MLHSLDLGQITQSPEEFEWHHFRVEENPSATNLINFKNCAGAAVLLGLLYLVVWGSFFINVTLGLLNKEDENNHADAMRHRRGHERRSDAKFLAATGERRLGGQFTRSGNPAVHTKVARRYGCSMMFILQRSYCTVGFELTIRLGTVEDGRP